LVGQVESDYDKELCMAEEILKKGYETPVMPYVPIQEGFIPAAMPINQVSVVPSTQSQPSAQNQQSEQEQK
jgi:hypothetical protein